jgi:hypothetical protein
MRALALALQLIVVVTHGWDAGRGELHRFERLGDGWHEVGAPVPVALGSAGLGWGRGLHPEAPRGEPRKKEGDRRSPAGLFELGPTYDAADLVCVDDPASPDYNRVVPRGRGEDMKLYRRAVFVAHNPGGARGEGSCIFLHDGDSPTVGCTAMAPAALDELVAWRKPGVLLVQLPRAVYRRVRAKWKLPPI